jgi:hypothetical protein
MSCKEIQEEIERFLSGALSGFESRRIRIHLRGCPACASRLSPSDRVETLVALDEDIEPSPGLERRFRARLEAHRARSAGRWWTWIPASRVQQTLALAGSLAVLAGVVIFWTARPTEPPPPTPPPEAAIVENLPLLQDLGVIENLELLEDFDVLQEMSTATPKPPQ